MRTLRSPPPGRQASASRSAGLCRALVSTTLLASKGSLCRAKNKRALAFCAPFCRFIHREGRLRREADLAQFLRLIKDDKTRM
jgi:hypothetical protein